MIFNAAHIEEELQEIQRRNSSTEARTTILNLVVFSTLTNSSLADAALGQVLGKRAARVIHVMESNAASSDVHVSARCYLDRERKSVCFQEVQITSGADGVGSAPGTWTPLLVRDIPTYLVWLSGISGHTTLLYQAQEQADKLLIDSESNSAGGENPISLYHALTTDARSAGVAVSDFAWQRLRPLRTLTAHVFDSAYTIDRLRQIKSIRMDGTPAVFTELYIAWLAGRLSWRGKHGELRDQQGRPITIRSAPVSPESDQGKAHVRFDFHQGAAIEILADNSRGCARVTGAPHLAQKRVYRVPSNGEILLNEIDSVHNEYLYNEAVETLLRTH